MTIKETLTNFATTIYSEAKGMFDSTRGMSLTDLLMTFIVIYIVALVFPAILVLAFIVRVFEYFFPNKL